MEAYNFNEKISEQEEIIDLDEEDVADGTDLEKLEQQLFDDEMNETGIETGDENEEGSYWRSIHLVDTAGIRKQKSIKGFVESQSVYRSLRCISESDVVLYMVDATKGVGHQDRRLLDIALEKGKSVIICMNKMDLMKEKLKSSEDRKNWLQDLRDHLPWLAFCDIVPISAKHGKAIKRLKKVIKKSIITRHKVIPTGELNRAVFELVERNPVIVKKSGGKRLKVKYTSHIKSDPPTFLFFTNRSKGVPENYQRYLKNGLRQYFELDNAPVHLMFRTGKDLSKRGKLNETEKKILEK
jgi:GTP-binding protein